MKKKYYSPSLDVVSFKSEDVLGISGESPILEFTGENTPKDPAENFGSIDIF